MKDVLCVVNRVLLALLGLAVAAVGAAVLLTGFDLPRPGFIPFEGPDDVLLSRKDRRRYRDAGWWWPTLVAALSVLVLCCVWWLTSQLRQRRLGEVSIDTARPDDDATGPVALLRGRALEDVMAEEAGTLDGVERAHVTLTGRRTAPRARFGILLGPGARPAAAVGRIEDGALGQARQSTGLPRLPAEVRLRAAKHRAERVT